MNSLGRQDVQPAFGVGQGAYVIGPHTGAVDDVLGTTGDLVTGLEIVKDSAVGTAASVLGDLYDLRAAGSAGAVGHRGTDQGQDQAGIIHRGVVVLHRSDGLVRLEVGKLLVQTFA